jgi:hypothetical protein
MQNFVNSLNLLCDMQIQVYTNLGPRVYEIWTLVVCTLICYLDLYTIVLTKFTRNKDIYILKIFQLQHLW